MHWKSGCLWVWLVKPYNLFWCKVRHLKLAGLGFFFHTEAKLLETLMKQYGEKLLPGQPSILARHFPVATGTQPQVSCLTLPGQMLFNADRQWLLVGSLHLLLSPALSVHLEILTHIWEIFLTSAFLGSDIVVQNISVTFSFKLYWINLEPAFKRSSVSSGCVQIFRRTQRVSRLYIFWCLCRCTSHSWGCGVRVTGTGLSSALLTGMAVDWFSFGCVEFLVQRCVGFNEVGSDS